METWTTRKLLAWTTQHFEDKAIDSPRVAAEMLLGHVLGVPRLKLYMEPDRPASAEERDTFRALVARAGRHEPVDYLIGKAPFFSLEFRVTPAVLIPRPSTETIVEHVLQRTRPQTPPPEIPPGATADAHHSEAVIAEEVPEADRPEGEEPWRVRASTRDFRGRIADVCTGSGVIAIALAKHLPDATFVATDLSEDALVVARQNAEAHGVADRIDFRQGDLLTPLGDERFDYLLSNPPYIGDAEWAEVLPNVKDYEPVAALRSGADGLDHLRRLIAEAPGRVIPGGQALFEFSSTQTEAISQLAGAATSWNNPIILKDHERLPRVLVVDASQP
ncbi:MAG: HemK/PrmC family methyltransferase [Planctomycetota bacterium]